MIPSTSTYWGSSQSSSPTRLRPPSSPHRESAEGCCARNSCCCCRLDMTSDQAIAVLAFKTHHACLSSSVKVMTDWYDLLDQCPGFQHGTWDIVPQLQSSSMILLSGCVCMSPYCCVYRGLGHCHAPTHFQVGAWDMPCHIRKHHEP